MHKFQSAITFFTRSFLLLSLSFLAWPSAQAALGDPLIISVGTAPVVTGSGVGQVIIFEDAGWLDAIANDVKDPSESYVDLRGEVTQVVGTPTPDYQVTGDDFRVRLNGVGQISIKWEIYEAVAGSGNGATGVLGIGSPSVLVKDIDGPNIEHVGSNLNNLKSYSVEAGPPVTDLISSTATVPFIIFSGTQSRSASDTEAMAKFSWDDVSSFEIFYQAESGGRNYDQDGDGDISFVSENVVDLPPTVTNGSSYINDANKAAYDVTGTCTAAGDSITINLDDTVTTIGPLATTCGGDGTFSVTTNATTLNDGPVTITTQIDDAVNAVVTDIDVVTKDTVAPVVPPVTAPDLASGTDTGTDNADDITNNLTPDFTIDCVSGNTVNLFVDAVAAGTGTCVGGTVTITSTQNLSEGANAITFTETDPYENESAVSPSLSVTLETVASAAPVINAPTGGANVPALVNVTGTCVNGDTVSISNANLVVNPVTVACAGGTYDTNVTFAPAANGNAEVLSVTQIDYVGNESVPDTVNVNVDSEAPGNPATDALLTNDNRPPLTGTLAAPTAAGDTVEVTIDGNTYPATNNGNGTWSLADNVVATLADGFYSVLVTVTDPVGNESSATDNNIVEVDTNAPGAPTVDGLHNTTVSTLTPTVSGSGGNSGDTIVVTGPLGETCTTVVAVTGAWSCDIAPALAEGGPQTLSVTAEDPAGNTSGATNISITTDTNAPAPPVVTTPIHGGFDNDTTPVFTGTGEVGATVLVSDGAGSTCTTTVQPDNSWTCEVGPALTVGVLNNFVVTQTDAGSNTSSNTLVNLTIDTTDPDVTLNRSTGQLEVTSVDEAKFTLVFNEPIDVASFIASDVLLSGTTGTITTGPVQIAPNDATTFEITITGMTDGDTVTASLPVGVVTDLAGNPNTVATGAGNTVGYDTSVDTDGDGLSDLVEAQLGTNPLLDDSDADGNNDDNNDLDNIHPTIELAAPNGGDANGDGFLDAVQTTVASRPNTLNGLYNSIETANSGVTNCGQITRFNSLSEDDLSSEDPADDYPLGLWDFQITCDNPGDTAIVIIYLDKLYDTSSWKYKKYDSVLKQYSDISASIIYGQANVGGTFVSTIQYSVTDGGALDADGVANGVIEDPAGPSLPFVPTVNTVPERTGGTATTGRGRYAGQTREEYRASQQYAGEVTKHNFDDAYAFSQTEVAKLNAGNEAQMLTYTDAYGREKFAGYQHGRLAKEDVGGAPEAYIVWRTDREKSDIDTVVDKRDLNAETFLASAPITIQAPRYSIALFKDVSPTHSIYQAVMDAYSLRLINIEDEKFRPFGGVSEADVNHLLPTGLTGRTRASIESVKSTLAAFGIVYEKNNINRLKLAQALSDYVRGNHKSWFEAADESVVLKRLNKVRKITFGELNLDEFYGSAEINPAKLEKTSDVQTIINRREQGVNREELNDVLRTRLGFEYADPDNPGWLPQNPDSGRAAIKRNDQSIIKRDRALQRIDRRGVVPATDQIIIESDAASEQAFDAETTTIK